jgi:hypothetical protein
MEIKSTIMHRPSDPQEAGLRRLRHGQLQSRGLRRELLQHYGFNQNVIRRIQVEAIKAS